MGRVEFVKYLLQKCFSALRKLKSRFLDNIDNMFHLIGNRVPSINQINAMCAAGAWLRCGGGGGGGGGV